MKRILKITIIGVALSVVVIVCRPYFFGAKTIDELLANSDKLKQAISTLKSEEQICFVKVVKQEERKGQLYSTIKFIETALGDPCNRILEKEYEIKGDVVHFDALIITFAEQAVMGGGARSLYLWHQVYGDKMPSVEGCEIDAPGTQPERYTGLLHDLEQDEQILFWKNMWNLGNDPEALRDLGITAISCNVVHKHVRPGLIYTFRIGSDGLVYPETVKTLLTKKRLRKSIESLPPQDQIGFVKLVKQEQREGSLYTTIKFVETAVDDAYNPVFEKVCEIEGDTVRLDASVIAFADPFLRSGKVRSLYLWRCVYGESMSPSRRCAIGTVGSQPERYAGLLRELKLGDQVLFWEAMWELDNGPGVLHELGIKSLSINVLLKDVRPGYIYLLKIGSDGQIYPENILDM